MDKVMLICIPHAGGNSSWVNDWKKYFPVQIEPVSIEMAGRGSRFMEDPYNNLKEAAEDILHSIEPIIQTHKYVFLGHSMGSLISYELVRMIIKRGLPLPEHLFISGRRAPHNITKINEYKHTLSDTDFIQMLFNLGGTPHDFFKSEQLLNLYIPIIRADYKMVETYKYEPLSPLECNITVFFGKDDSLEKNDPHGWRIHTNKEFKVYLFDGGHFFINNHKKSIANIIMDSLVFV